MDNTVKEQECKQISKQIMTIEKTITLIEENLSDLNLRLVGALRVENINVEKEDSVPVQSLVPIAENLSTSADRLENVNFSLQSILNRLEI